MNKIVKLICKDDEMIIVDTNIANKSKLLANLINDSLLVTTLHSKSLAAKDNIKLKDVIYEIESKSVKDYFYEKFKDFGSTSNLNNARNIYSYYWLLSSNKDSMHVKFISADKKIESKYVKLYEYETYKPEERENISILKQILNL